MASKAGRNDPCPCGSGRKYKRCCLGTDEARERVEPSAGMIESHVDLEILKEMKVRCPRAYERAMASEGDYAFPPDQLLPFWIPLITWEAEDAEGRAAEVVAPFVSARLSAAASRYVQAQLASWTSIWRALDVTPGEGCRLRDELTGVERVVRERTATQTLRPGAALLGRVVRNGASWMLHGIYPRTLPEDTVEDIVDYVRFNLDLGSDLVDPTRLHGLTAFELAGLVHEKIVSLEFDRTPHLVDGEGNDLCFVNDEYTFEPSDHARLVSALEMAAHAHRGMPGRGEDDDETEGEHWVLTREREDGSDGILASLDLGDDWLRVEAFSLEAGDDTRRLVEQDFGVPLKLVRRSSQDPLDPLGRV